MYNSGRRGRRANDGYGILSQADTFNQREYPIPVVTTYAVTNGSYVPQDDAAVDTAGGQTIVLYGSGFAPGATVTVGGVTIGAVTYLDQGRLTFTAPAKSSGSYTVVVINSNGGAGILVPGLVYSGVPVWSTSAGSVGSVYERTNVSSTFVATGDAPMTYSILSGSLPPGTSLSTTGVLSGSAPADSGSTTYSFTIRATDGELQDTDRSFSLTINTDVVTMSSPTNNQVISSYEYAAISNVTVAGTSAAGFGVVYSANAVPTGITLNANTGVISGTSNTVGNTYTRLTATANTTLRTALRDVIFNVNQDVVTWSSPADGTSYSLSGGSAISPVSLSATSAAGFGVQYSANALPSGLSISGSTISGTPDTAQTVNTLLTATANTTGRSATRTISWSISLGDAYWKNVSLALNATPTVTPFHMDLSNNNSQLTIAGDTRPSLMNPYQEGYYSNYFDGSGDYLSIAGSSQLVCSGDFTISAWTYFNTLPTYSELFGQYYSAGTSDMWLLEVNSNGSMLLYCAGSAASPRISTSASIIKTNTWQFVSIVRASNTVTLYVDGTSVGSVAKSGTWGTASYPLTIGAYYSPAAGFFNGYISNFRFVNGTAITGVPTSPLTAVTNTVLLTCQSNRLIDNSINNFTITKNGDTKVSSAYPFTSPATVPYNTQYSTYFDGDGDYLLISDNANLEIGAVDFTVEAWFNIKSLPSSGNFADIVTKGASGVYEPYYIFVNSSGSLLYYSSSAGASWDIASGVSFGTITPGIWYHVAVSRQGTNTRMFLNGALINTIANSGGALYNNSTAFGICGRSDGTETAFIGSISNVRLVNGTAVYTSAFTPPTSPLTAIPNTQVLTCQDSTIKDNSPNNFTITSYGQAQPIALSPFTMTTANTTVTSLGSTYLPNNGSTNSSWITGYTSPTLGTQDHTVEFWMYMTASPQTYAIPWRYCAGTQQATNDYGIQVGSTGGSLFLGGGGSWTIGSTFTIPSINAWHHFALTRSGSTFRLFIDGVLTVTATSSQSIAAPNANMMIGAYSAGAVNGNYFQGYISDFRYIIGTALYTANFTPPTSPLTAVANTRLLTCQTNGGHNNSQFVDQSSFNNIVTRLGNATQGTFSPYSQNGWSNYFDGTGDYLSVTSPSGQMDATGDFTMELWIYWHSMPTAGYQNICGNGNISGTYGLMVGNTNQNSWTAPYVFKLNQASVGDYINGNTTIVAGQWYHLAHTRTSGVNRLFVNGVLQTNTATETTSRPYGTNGTFLIGQNSNCIISNLRYVKGTSLYTATFTPSTTPLTAVANTQLLTCADNRFIDKSPNNLTITRSGDVAVQAFSPFGGITSVPTSYSNYFDGTGDYLSLPSSSNLLLGTGDFTIEYWVNVTQSAPTNESYVCHFSYGTTGNVLRVFSFYTSAAGWQHDVWIGASNIVRVVNSSAINGWAHVALVRNGTTLTSYINGVSINSVTAGTDLNTGTLDIGRSSTLYMMGYISNFRVIKGTALYTSTFTPSTTPLSVVANTQLLTCQSTTMIDNSTNNFAITAGGDVKPTTFNPFGTTNTTGVAYTPTNNGGSLYCLNTSSYLNTTFTGQAFGTGDFTVECWLYATASAHNISVCSITTNTWGLITYSNNVYWQFNGGNLQSGGTVPLNAWSHIAISRVSGVTKGFLNGVQIFSAADTSNYSTNPTRGIGSNGGSAGQYISDFRVVAGKGLYTSSFTPPTAPLTPVVYSNNSTAIANTAYAAILVNGTSGGIVDSHGTNNLETVGDTKLAPESPFEGSYYSNYFGGASYASIAAGLVNWNADFCIEFWVNTTLGNGLAAVGSSWNGVFGSGSFTIWLENGAVQLLHANSSGTNQGPFIATSAGLVNDGNWHHVAITQVSGSPKLFRIFVDGILRAYKSETTWTDIGTSNFNISYDNASYPRYFTGYLSNYRITSNIPSTYVTSSSTTGTVVFTPSTTALTAISGTSLLTCQSNKLLDNSSNARTVTATGTITTKSFNPFKRNTGQSIYFDGSGDYILTPSTQLYSFGSSDFTIEFWINTTSTTAYMTPLRFADTWGTGAWSIYFNDGNGDGYPSFWSYTLNAAYTTSGAKVNNGAWNHIAVVRSGSSFVIYINGVSRGTGTNSGSMGDVTSRLWIGRDSSNVREMTGYLRDIRITRYARYTTTFTPPTTTFEVK